MSTSNIIAAPKLKLKCCDERFRCGSAEADFFLRQV